MSNLGRWTRKLLTMCKGLHPKSCASRLYLSIKDNGRGLKEIEDSSFAEEISLGFYILNSGEAMLEVLRKHGHRNTDDAKEPKVFK